MVMIRPSLFLGFLMLCLLPNHVFAKVNAVFRAEVRGPTTEDELRKRYPQSNGQFLARAIRSQDLEGITFILQDQTDIAPDQARALLMVAIRMNYEEPALRLLAGGIHIKDEQAVFLACSWGREQVFENLLKLTRDVNVRDPLGNTLLHCAASRGHDALVALLLKHGVDRDLNDANGLTAQQRATLAKRHSTAALLLS